MITRRQFLGLGARAAAAAATTYAASRLAHSLVPARPAVAGRLEYTVTSLADGAVSPPIAVTLRPQGAPLPHPTPTPFSEPLSAEAQVRSAIPNDLPIASLTGPAGREGFRITIKRAENIDGASFAWDFGSGARETGPSIDVKPGGPGGLAGSLDVSDGSGLRLATIPLVRLAAYDTPPILTTNLPNIGVQAHVNQDLPEDQGGINGIPNVLKAIARLHEMGMNLTRSDWVWEKVEAAEGAYNWNNYQFEDVLRLLDSNGIGSLAIIKGTPQWASSQPNLPPPGYWNVAPADPRAYGRYVYKFIEHYGPVIKMLEVYQEPNVSLYWNFDAEGLAGCQREGFLHAKYANPDVAVGFTGLVGIPEPATLGDDGYWHYGDNVRFESPEVFLNRVYQATNGRVWWDTMGLHVYPDMGRFSSSTGFDLSRSIAFINSIKAVMQRYGDATPFSITEVGTSTPNDQPSPYLVANFLGQLIDAIRQNTYCPILIWYMLNEGPTRSHPDHRRGLATYDLLHLTPIGQMMRTYIEQH